MKHSGLATDIHHLAIRDRIQMEALFTALAHYIDFLVLGAVALALFCAPFGFVKPLTDGWQFFSKLVADSHTFIQAGLISGVFFAVFYFSGYFLNAVGHAFLHTAHFSIIDTTAKLAAAKQAPENSQPKIFPGPSGIFYGRTIPIVGLVLHPLKGDEVKSYWRDAERQVYWGICDWKSLDDMGGGPLTNQLRLLRGLVGLMQILVLLCVIAFVLSFFQRYRYAENQMWWSLATFVVALFLYFFAIFPAYWDAEFEVHSAIWSAFPKAPSEMEFKDVLPCKKLIIQALGKRESAKELEEGVEQPQKPRSPEAK